MSSHTWQAAGSISWCGCAHAAQVQEVEAAVSGSLPSWLDGTFLLNGGGDFTGMVRVAAAVPPPCVSCIVPA